MRYLHNTFGANHVTLAMMRTLTLFFGTDRVTFDVASLAPLATEWVFGHFLLPLDEHGHRGPCKHHDDGHRR